MTFDHLQKLIHARKNPVALTLAPPVDKPSDPEALFRAGAEVMDALAGLVPAVIFRVPCWEALGWQGMAALERSCRHAGELGLFVVADARRGDAGPTAAACGRMWLGQGGMNADCLTVNAYQGSDAVRPVLDSCGEDRCLLLVARTDNPSAGEVQSLLSGDRVVGQAVGDLAERLGREYPGQALYSRVGAMVSSPWPSDLRSMRKRMEHTFFLLSAGHAGACSLEDAWYAFDRLGRGALVALEPPALWDGGGEAARRAVEEARDVLRQFINFL